MPSPSLRTLARNLDVPERTLRRAATEGLIRGRRTSPRRYETSLREEAYLRRQWPLLRELRAALRTEPNARLAVLFGSQATGRGSQRSDVDVLVVLDDPSAVRVAELAGRLERRLGRDVQLVRLQEAERAPSLMVDVLEHGRVLVDRDGRWPRLSSRAATWRRRAAATEVPLDQAMPDLDLPEMTEPPPPAPLERQDPDRARALKAKIRDRVADVRRHLVALRTAMAEFGEDFDLEPFRTAYASDDPVALNRVKAVERGVDQLYNYVVELAVFGLELAEVRPRDADLNARRDLQSLRRIGVIGPERAQRLERLRELRRLLVHEYATATADQVHEAARIIASEFVPFYDAYRAWIARGFSARPPDR